MLRVLEFEIRIGADQWITRGPLVYSPRKRLGTSPGYMLCSTLPASPRLRRTSRRYEARDCAPRPEHGSEDPWHNLRSFERR